MRTQRICLANAVNMVRKIAFLTVCAFIAAGCATPNIKPADPQLLFTSGLLNFLQDGTTTREEVVLKLGVPSAQIEGDRILMYQLKTDKLGNWGLIAPQWNAAAGMRTWSGGTGSLVLIFDENGFFT